VKTYQSWGRFPQVQQQIHHLQHRAELLPNSKPLLSYGLGRSYGDSCLNDGGMILDTARLDHLIDFDSAQGFLRCESGVSLEEIINEFAPRGWFPSVVPGTQLVTVGGAIANDIHGKNHHRSGTFGAHVRRFELLRSNGERLVCSAEENEKLFAATIGGLGLTGLITWVEIALRHIPSSLIDCEIVKFRSLAEFFDLSAESDERFEHIVSWVDSTARGASLGRGLLMRGNWSETPSTFTPRRGKWWKNLPFDAPSLMLNRVTIRLFNELYYGKQRTRLLSRKMDLRQFFFPLDALSNWNRMYGKRGFLQYQCVVPFTRDQTAITEIFRRIAQYGSASFLAVLKTFGSKSSRGMLSFPREGVTLALDFPNCGTRLFSLLEELDAVVRESHGAVYPAKDARMSRESFAAFYPQAREFADYVDPNFSSSFWRRVFAS
jgi:FAD/FMN-containing dehydrogenase